MTLEGFDPAVRVEVMRILDAAAWDELEDDFLSDEAQRLLAQLPFRERRILSLRFGFEDGESWSIEAVARELGLSELRVTQLEEQGLYALQLQAGVG